MLRSYTIRRHVDGIWMDYAGALPSRSQLGSTLGKHNLDIDMRRYAAASVLKSVEYAQQFTLSRTAHACTRGCALLFW